MAGLQVRVMPSNAWLHVCLLNMHVHNSYADTHTCMCICVYTHMYTHACMDAWAPFGGVCVCVLVGPGDADTYIYIYIYICMYAYIVYSMISTHVQAANS